MAIRVEQRSSQPAVAAIPISSLTYQVYDLTRISIVSRALKHRAFQYTAMIVNLFFFALIVLSGIFGTPVGNRNFSTVFVWIVWWALLIILLVPFSGRSWCMACPIPAIGEWTQRASFIHRGGRPFGLGLTWPKAFRNIWLQNLSFVGITIFSAVILTRPAVTGFLLLGFAAIALVLSLLYRRRAFCRYVCPVGGFIGLYSMVAPLEIRVKDAGVCLKHCAAECARGSPNAYGCPWMEYPGTLRRNAYCGMCTECLKACPTGNVAVNLRPFGVDLLRPVRHMAEAFKGYIMLGAAAVYAIVMLGPWGFLKQAANLGSGDPAHFALYAAGLVATILVLVPALFLSFAWLAMLVSGSRNISLRRLFVSYGYTTIPLGLVAWIAFTLSFVLANGSYALPVISDPFGWGWNLFGTADYQWIPYGSAVLPYIQLPVLLGGLMLSILLANRLAHEQIGDRRHARRSVVPMAILLTLITAIFVWLFIG